MGAIIFLLLIALIPASIASKKGRSFGLWYFYGVCLWIVALIHSIVISDTSGNQNSNSNSNNNSYRPYEPMVRTEPITTTVNEVKCTSVDINAKVRIQSWNIEKDSQENTFLKISVFNTTSDIICALNLIVKGYDSFNNLIKVNNSESFPILIQDLKLLPQKLQAIENRIILPDCNIRKVEMVLCQDLVQVKI